jgi:hypothetical protein
MLADIPAVAYTASWSDFFNAEFTANFKIDFFTASRRDRYFEKTELLKIEREFTFSSIRNDFFVWTWSL